MRLPTACFAAYTSFAIVTNSVVGVGTVPTGPGIRQLLRRGAAAKATGTGTSTN